MLIDAWATTQKIQEDTGMTMDQILALPADEYARLSGRQTPAEAAVAALDAAYGPSVPQAPHQPPAPVQEPQGIDLASMTMEQYAAVRGQLGVQGRQYGRGIMQGGGTADWIAAAQSRGIGRTSYGQQNVQDAARVDAGKYLRTNEPVAGRTTWYR